MTVIDPDSPLSWTICGQCGRRHDLGDVDCAGYEVGYITAGCVWESRQEHDVAIAAGRAFDAWKRWVWDACLGPEPDLWGIIRAHCLPQWEDEALREMLESVRFFQLAGSHRPAS